jgi:hypothetical protein
MRVTAVVLPVYADIYRVSTFGPEAAGPLYSFCALAHLIQPYSSQSSLLS